MSWRSVVITQPSRLKLKQNSMVVVQSDGEVCIPLKDVAVLLIDSPETVLTGQLLSACADHKIATITVGADHHPNGVLLPYLPHSRALKTIRKQIMLKRPQSKRLWQSLIKQKIRNQSLIIKQYGDERVSKRLAVMAEEVKSGDPDNMEAFASQIYFPALFGEKFTRQQTCFWNSALNYGYAIIRAALARHLACYGFITAIGLHHHNQQNSFNLADDLIEPFRPLIDGYLMKHFRKEEGKVLVTKHKATLVDFLNQDIVMVSASGVHTKTTCLVATQAIVRSLTQRLMDGKVELDLPSCTY